MRSRSAVSAIFFINGVVLASWVPHIPAVKAAHGLSDGQLGIVLLAMAVGAVLALPLAGWLVGRTGSRRMTAVAAMALGIESVPHVAGTARLSLVAVGRSLPWLAPSGAPRASAGPVFARPTGALLGLGALAFCGLLAEGAMGDWSAVYLHDALGSSPPDAPLASRPARPSPPSRPPGTSGSSPVRR